MMVITRILAALGLALLGAGPAAAQSFRGEGPDTTRPFPLAQGTAVIEVEHRGTGAFVVRLMNEAGVVVDEVARGSGTFGGSKAIGIPGSGAYRFDIDAVGAWTVRVASIQPAGADSESARRGTESGLAAANEPGTTGWLGKGFASGVIAGPLGIAFMISRVEKATEQDVDSVAAALPADDLAWAAAYRDAFATRLRSRRQRSAVIGGVIGTGVFIYALTKIIDFSGGGPGDGPIDGGGGSPFLVVPIRF